MGCSCFVSQSSPRLAILINFCVNKGLHRKKKLQRKLKIKTKLLGDHVLFKKKKITQEIFQSEHISAAICLRLTLLFITTIII